MGHLGCVPLLAADEAPVPEKDLTDPRSRGHGGNPCGASAEVAGKGEDPSALPARPALRDAPLSGWQLPPLSSSDSRGRRQQAPTLLCDRAAAQGRGCQRGPRAGKAGREGAREGLGLGVTDSSTRWGRHAAASGLMVLCQGQQSCLCGACRLEVPGKPREPSRWQGAVRTCRSPQPR